MDQNRQELAALLQQISQRGDHFGDHGGLHSLLEWCGKNKIPDVTEEEARLFLANPDAPPPQTKQSKTGI